MQIALTSASLFVNILMVIILLKFFLYVHFSLLIHLLALCQHDRLIKSVSKLDTLLNKQSKKSFDLMHEAWHEVRICDYFILQI